jgi:membrane dipeptidase
MFKIADAHSDFLAYNVLEHSESQLFNHANLELMITGGVTLQTFAVWVPPQTKDKLAAGLKQIDFFHSFIEKNISDIKHCVNSACLASPHPIKAVLAIESGESIDCRNDQIPKVYDKGVRIFSLTWNGENAYASGCLAEGGLKKQGIEAIGLLNSLNIALDVSHINEQGFWGALEHYEHAPCATHSCVNELHTNSRNLKNEQIKAIIARDGFIGINFYTEFLRGEYAAIDDILDHIEYVLDCGGEDAVGFGSDFCGIEHTPKGLDSVADFQKIPEAMLRRRFPDSLISKICYGNFARFILKFLKQ